MFTSAEREWLPEHLEPVEVAYYREVLVTHANDLVLGVCSVCQVARCMDWCNAYGRLAAAGELMASERWRGIVEVVDRGVA